MRAHAYEFTTVIVETNLIENRVSTIETAIEPTPIDIHHNRLHVILVVVTVIVRCYCRV
jgi:hypothetical protein